MPSPFPGMDPYLEGALWTTFHFAFGAEIVRQLAPRLRPRYLVLPVERFVIDTFDDIAITANISPDVGVAKSAREPPAVYAPTAAVSPLHLATVIPEAVPHLEIDLLRHGRRLPMRDALPPAEYFILLSRAQNRPMSEVWPLVLRDPLPAVPIPLLPGDADVTLDLQQTFTATYDLLGYDLAIDDTRSPEPALDDAASVIADSLLRMAGLRPA